MIVQFNKNIQFSKLVKCDGRLREFNFRKVNGLNDELFTVDVSDDRGNRIMFKMHKEPSGWALQPGMPVPEWVRVAAPQFNDLIEEELRMA